jgi:hypothetical protein
MSVPRLYPFGKLKKKAKEYNIEWIPKGRHGRFKGPNTKGEIHIFPLPHAQHRKEVTREYLKSFLRRFGLNEDFFSD